MRLINGRKSIPAKAVYSLRKFPSRLLEKFAGMIPIQISRYWRFLHMPRACAPLYPWQLHREQGPTEFGDNYRNYYAIVARLTFTLYGQFCYRAILRSRNPETALQIHLVECQMAKEHLKSSYKTTLWLFAVANVAIFWSAVIVRDVSNLGQIFSSIGARDATFAALGPVAILVLSGIISASNKARVIYWRYTHPLPGCFAFTRYLPGEHRASRSVLEEKWGPLPTDPAEQNQLWYQMYRDVESEIRIHETHRDSLFSRDLTGYAVIFLVVFGVAAALSTLPWKTTGFYIGFLIVQYVALMVAARTYGVRLVCNVLAQQSAKGGGVG